MARQLRVRFRSEPSEQDHVIFEGFWNVIATSRGATLTYKASGTDVFISGDQDLLREGTNVLEGRDWAHFVDLWVNLPEADDPKIHQNMNHVYNHLENESFLDAIARIMKDHLFTMPHRPHLPLQ